MCICVQCRSVVERGVVVHGMIFCGKSCAEERLGTVRDEHAPQQINTNSTRGKVAFLLQLRERQSRERATYSLYHA